MEKQAYNTLKHDEWLKDVLRLECQLFIKTDIYRLIEQKQDKKCLRQDERLLLYTEIHHVFQRLIKTLREFCPDLTKEDIIFCCLAKSGLDKPVINCCMGASRQTSNQRKYRIKKKMKDMKCEDLFELIYRNDDLA
jgi:hypothetical protein